ncbi:UNVERIFIED_CONTAM: hypothetical protein FKN15_036411 [Acipenser sinensis]
MYLSNAYLGASGSVVLSLMKPYLGKGHIVYTDNWPVMKVTDNVDHATGDNKVKPECVLEYNQKMGSVDKSDMQISFIDCASKSLK